MPAESEAQRRYLNAHFGHAWVKAHHFDNAGKLPEHVGKKRRRRRGTRPTDRQRATNLKATEELLK